MGYSAWGHGRGAEASDQGHVCPGPLSAQASKQASKRGHYVEHCMCVQGLSARKQASKQEGALRGTLQGRARRMRGREVPAARLCAARGTPLKPLAQSPRQGCTPTQGSGACSLLRWRTPTWCWSSDHSVGVGGVYSTTWKPSSAASSRTVVLLPHPVGPVCTHNPVRMLGRAGGRHSWHLNRTAQERACCGAKHSSGRKPPW